MWATGATRILQQGASRRQRLYRKHLRPRSAAHAGGGAATKRRIEITVERQRVTFLRRKGAAHGWCGACGREVCMVTPDEAALLAGLTARTIYRRVEGGSVHFDEAADGTLLICCNSLHEST